MRHVKVPHCSFLSLFSINVSVTSVEMTQCDFQNTRMCRSPLNTICRARNLQPAGETLCGVASIH